jgi:hypothetical protein
MLKKRQEGVLYPLKVHQKFLEKDEHTLLPLGKWGKGSLGMAKDFFKVYFSLKLKVFEASVKLRIVFKAFL